MQHANSPLTPKGRYRMVLLVEEEDFTFEAAAAASNVAKSTAHTWVSRWREAGEEQRRDLSCLRDRPSRPKRSPAQVPDAEARKICERREKTGWSPRRLADEPDIARPHSTVHRVLRRGGCSRRPRPEPPAVIRYEWPCPGNLLHMDVKKLGRFEEPGHALTGDRRKRSRRVGWEYVHSIVDDCSRLAYAEIHKDERAETVAAFTRRALEWFEERGIAIERLMTDNHFSYTKSLALAELLDRRAISHLRIRPYTPRTNGKVERFHQTLMREWAYALEYASSDARGKALPHWLEHYNERRSHSALGNRPPIARVRNVLGFDT
jgi:transposase InsO family protein